MLEDIYTKTRPLRSLFYIVTPNETSFDNIDEVPNYITEAIPFFTGLIILEQLIQWMRGETLLRINDSIGSISSGMIQELTKILVIAAEISAYVWFHEHFCIVELPSNSVWTWWLTLVGADFGYYWLHRMSHEVNIMWAAHQVHHSSEDYNLTTALRQSAFQQFFGALFYLPMALFVSPSIFLVHLQLSTLFQFYIHTCAIGKMGFLDYIFNTPSNHRVHHGRNRYCIDKNYGAMLMIWDHLFGTYQPEEDEVVYGLVHPLSSFEPFYVQFCHYIYIWKTFWATEGIGNKLSVLFKGPGWTPGQPRLGNIEDIPDISAPCSKYDPPQPRWINVYISIHFILIIIGYQRFALNHTSMNTFQQLTSAGFIVLSLTSFGATLDNLWFAPLLESVRCILFVVSQNCPFSPMFQLTCFPSAIQLLSVSVFFISALTTFVQCRHLLPPIAKTLKQS